jgi:hypothetical protein
MRELNKAATIHRNPEGLLMSQTVKTANSGGWATRSRWNPHLVGVGLGLLSWAVFAIVNNPLGVTTSLSQWAEAVAEPVMGAEGLRANS